MKVPPMAPACGWSMIACRPITPESGKPAAIDFATVIRSALDVEVLHREHRPRPSETGLHLVGDEHDPVAVAERAKPADEVGRRGTRPLAELGLEHDRGNGLG